MPVDHEQFSNLRVFEHPLVHDKLSRARNAATQPAQFDGS